MSLEREVRRRLQKSIAKQPIAYDQRRGRYVWIGGPNKAVKTALLVHEKAKAEGAIPGDTPLLLNMSKPSPASLPSLTEPPASPSSGWLPRWWLRLRRWLGY